MIKAYKGFKKDMTCRGFQFEEGKEYVHDGEVKVCEGGFHACERPLDCFDYYYPARSIYHVVYLECDVSKSDIDTKVASKKIKIGARLDIAGLVQAQLEYVKGHSLMENTDPKQASAGAYGAASAGENGAASAGVYGAAVSKGSADVGEYGIACVRGNGCSVKGGIGAILVIAEENEYDNDIKEWKAFVVDGVKIRADTWYCLKDGELVEVEE